jgi:hypothetical protein
MAIINGKPVKAFMYQDHEAHIRVHMAAMQDPKIAQLIGQNPNAQEFKLQQWLTLMNTLRLLIDNKLKNN